MSEVAAASGATMLSVRDLHAWYAESHVLHGMNFDLREGELLTLIGRNGAGKTTTLRSIMGLLKKRTGSITFRGTELVGKRTFEIARLGIGYCPEERAIFSSLSVRENLLLPPVLNEGGLSDEELFASFPNLKRRASSQGTKLSGGEQQMLAIARALMGNPRLLILDEPTMGLSPKMIGLVLETLTRIRNQQIPILLVEQNTVEAIRMADTVYALRVGEIVASMPGSDVTEDVLKTFYLG